MEATGRGRVERRLAAILAADVAGYSRLMGADEEGTHERLQGHLRELVNPKISEHRGRVVKNTGDGFLAEFASVVDAVRCAVEVQRGMTERNEGTPPERRIEFRVGINLGDVIVEEHDIFGDGVNVAARLEALAEPKGLSEAQFAVLYGTEDQCREAVMRWRWPSVCRGSAQPRPVRHSNADTARRTRQYLAPGFLRPARTPARDEKIKTSPSSLRTYSHVDRGSASATSRSRGHHPRQVGRDGSPVGGCASSASTGIDARCGGPDVYR